MQTRVVEKIPAGGKTFRNLASAHDYNRFLISLWQNRLPYSQELRALMALPNHDRICQGVDSMPASVRVYDKTGSTSQLCGNMGIIEAQTCTASRVPYVFVAKTYKRSERSERSEFGDTTPALSITAQSARSADRHRMSDWQVPPAATRHFRRESGRTRKTATGRERNLRTSPFFDPCTQIRISRAARSPDDHRGSLKSVSSASARRPLAVPAAASTRRAVRHAQRERPPPAPSRRRRRTRHRGGGR